MTFVKRHRSLLSSLGLGLSSLTLIGVSDLSAQEHKIMEKDIYKRSDILVSGKKHTLIPKGAALIVPEVHKNKFKPQASGSFERLSVFYRANYSWLQTFEVTIEQAKGKAPIDENKLEALKRTGKVIIAVYKDKNPISVKKYTPPKEKE